MDIRMYDTLHSIPLFQGMSAIDLNRIFDKVQLDIECLEQGEVFVHQGEACRQMVFLLNGTFLVETMSNDQTYTFSEQLSGPALLEGDILYGIQRNWTSTYTALDTCRLMLIPKIHVNQMLASMEIFRLNYLNTLCTIAARRRQKAWLPPAPTLRERFVHFVASHALQPKGEKCLTIRMSDLGSHLGATRALISSMLRKMQDEGLLSLTRQHIIIPELNDLT